MSESTAEATTTATETGATKGAEQQTENVTLPDDHPLVKTLAEQKKAIRDLKARAAKLDEIEEAQKSESEKAAERIAKAEAEVASVPTKVAEALRGHLVALHEIEQDDAELFLTANEPELLLKQVTRLLGQSDKRKKTLVVRGEGKTQTSSSDPKRDFLRGLAGSD